MDPDNNNNTNTKIDTNNIIKLRKKLQETKEKKNKYIHQYNAIKDASQKLMGQLAIIEEETTATMYERFGLEIDD